MFKLFEARQSALTNASAKKIRRMISKSEIKTFGLHTNEDLQYDFRKNSTMFRFGDKLNHEDIGMNQVHMYINENSLKRNTEFFLFNYFVELCELFEACYGFACIHVDSTDSQAVAECYKNTTKYKPIDCINSSFYVSDSDKVIKDVCWLNFISNSHMEQLQIEYDSILKDLPFYKKTSRGVYFAISNQPHIGEEEYDKIKQLRDLFKPIICEENWYNFM